jgi:hypothetical protein
MARSRGLVVKVDGSQSSVLFKKKIIIIIIFAMIGKNET